MAVIEGSSFVVNEKMCLVVSLRNEDLVALEFDKSGKAQIVARFQDIQVNIRNQIVSNKKPFE